jgi:hypothetical protein
MRAVDADPPRFRLVEEKDRLVLQLPQETLSAIGAMLGDVVPRFARYAWFIDAEGGALVFEGSPPSDRTYLMRQLGWTVCDSGDAVRGFRIHPTPNLAPFEIRLHVLTLGPVRPEAVLICQPHENADEAAMEKVLAGMCGRLERMVIDGLWILPPPGRRSPL